MRERERERERAIEREREREREWERKPNHSFFTTGVRTKTKLFFFPKIGYFLNLLFSIFIFFKYDFGKEKSPDKIWKVCLISGVLNSLSANGPSNKNNKLLT